MLLHGLATTRAIWDGVVPSLARSRRAVTLDVPGFGASPPVGPGFDLGAVAAAIAGGLPAGLEPFDLVGHSLGAGIALTLAAEHPQAVRRLVLVAPAGIAAVPAAASLVMSAGVEPLLAARRRLAPLSDLAWGRRALLAFAAADPAAIAPVQARLMLEASATAQRTSAALATITRADLRPLLRRVRAPLGVIWGAQDRTISVRTAEVIRRLRPRCEITIVPDAGHVVMVERPDAFVAALEALLERLPKHATTPSGGRSRVS